MREIRDPKAMHAFGRELAQRLGERHLLLLDGPMGAGKTELTRALAEALGSTETCSPSFAIHYAYPRPGDKGEIHHLDLFRMESADDLESTGFWDLFSLPKGIVIVEWSDKLADFGLKDQLPRSWPRTHVRIEVPNPGATLRIVKEN